MKRTKPTNRTPAQCKICGHKSPSYVGLATHLRNYHHITPKEYFDTYIEPFDHKCIHCKTGEVKFINMHIGYATSCGSHDCALKASKKTKFEAHGDENYNNRKQFKHTIETKKIEDPHWIERVIGKQQTTISKYLEEDPDYYKKRTAKSKATKKDKYGDEIYNGKEKREKTLMESYGVINVFQLETVKEKSKQTCLEHLGVEHAMQSQVCKDKRVQTYRKNYGVDNPSQLKENRELAKRTTAERHGDPNYRNVNQAKQTNAKKSNDEKEAIKRKREEYNLKTYGVRYPIALNTHRSSISNLSLRVKQILEKHKVHFVMEFRIDCLDNSSIVQVRRYDFKIGNTILEINGDYYHANPSIYESGTMLRIHHNDIKVDDIWADDAKKKRLAESKGYNVIYLWESDMKKMNDEQLFQWLNSNVINANFGV